MELIKDYELAIEYHPRKANVVANVLSLKSFTILAHIRAACMPLLMDMKALGLDLSYDGYRALLVSFMVRPSLVD